MNSKKGIAGVIVLLLLALTVAWYFRQRTVPAPEPTAPASPVQATLKPIVVNEAVRSVVYIPVYFALEKGYFRDAGLDVSIVTGGTATNAFAAMTSGEAQFAVADPMYVPISREQGARTKVISQVVARIAVWAVTNNPKVQAWAAKEIRKKTVSTQIRPMTAYVYAVRALKEIGLNPEKDVALLENKPPSEIAPLLAGKADVAFTLEPNTSNVVAQGGRVILSYPEKLGDQVFTGLMAKEDYIAANRADVIGFVRALRRAMDDIHRDPASALPTARKFFPQLKPEIIQASLQRLVAEKVIPTSTEISEDSWNRAIKVRVEAGDLKAAHSREDGCDLELMRGH